MQPERRAPIAVASTFLEEDSNGWLVTFSDLVLQLFAFVLVAAVLGPGRTSLPTAAETVTLRPPVKSPAASRVRTEAPEFTSGAEGHRSIGRGAPERTGPKCMDGCDASHDESPSAIVS